MRAECSADRMAELDDLLERLGELGDDAEEQRPDLAASIARRARPKSPGILGGEGST